MLRLPSLAPLKNFSKSSRSHGTLNDCGLDVGSIPITVYVGSSRRASGIQQGAENRQSVSFSHLKRPLEFVITEHTETSRLYPGFPHGSLLCPFCPPPSTSNRCGRASLEALYLPVKRFHSQQAACFLAVRTVPSCSNHPREKGLGPRSACEFSHIEV